MGRERVSQCLHSELGQRQTIERAQRRGSRRTVLYSMSSEGTVLSHDVNKELTGIAHSVLEGLATGGELRRNGR